MDKLDQFSHDMGREDQTNFADTHDRRRFLKAVGLMGLTSLAGCTGGRSETTTSGGGTTEAEGTERGSETTSIPADTGGIQTGGNLRIGHSNSPQSLHPMMGITVADNVFKELMYSRLTNVNADLEVIPELATEWEGNDAKDEWTFTLTEDAVFANTDGISVLAEDVEATVDVMLSEDRVSSAAQDLDPLDSVEVEDDHRITFRLSRSDLVYPKRIAETGSTFNILPRNVIEDRWDEISSTDFGSGPFTLTEYEEGGNAAFVAHEDYFKTDEDGNQLPYLDRMTWQFTPDAIARANALVDTRVDALQAHSPLNLNRVSQEGSIETQMRSSPEFTLIVLNETLELDNGDRPFADVQVRKAVKHALDREELVSAVGDNITIGHFDPVAPVHEFYADFPEGLEFGTTAQPDEARQLLDDAGYGDGLQLPTLPYSTQGAELRGPMVQLFQEQMAEVDIEFEIRQVTTDVYLSDYWNEDGVWYASGWGARIEDTTVPRLAVHSEGPWNSSRYSNDEYDRAFERAINATDRATFVEAFTEAQRIHHLTGSWLIFGFSNIYTAANNLVRNVNFLPSTSRIYHWNDWLTSEAPEGPE